MCVILIEIIEREIFWKCMDETMHPFYYNCPKILMDQLSPTENKNSLTWRELCRSEQKAQSIHSENPWKPVKF
jgi:hypothetical protein